MGIMVEGNVSNILGDVWTCFLLEFTIRKYFVNLIKGLCVKFLDGNCALLLIII